MSNVLITGGDGYIGNSLFSVLSHSHNVTKISRKNFDLSNSEEVRRFFDDKYFDVVIHSAVKGGSRLHPDTWREMDINLSMYYNLLQEKSHYGKLLHFGSGAEIYNPTSPYGLSKQIISKSISEIDNFYTIRIFAVFDEHEISTRFIKANVLRYINKESMNILNDKKMDFFYMKDFIKLVQRYVEHSSELSKEIDCVYDTSYFLSDIATFINTLGQHKVDIDIVSKDVGVDYVGKYININIPYDGLFYGINTVYENLLCKI